jgi:uncharacterized protein YegP (UPF0339 family)
MATFQLFRDTGGEFRWVLRADNGEPIADSGEGYADKADALNGIAAVRSEAAEAPLLDVSDATEEG